MDEIVKPELIMRIIFSDNKYEINAELLDTIRAVLEAAARMEGSAENSELSVTFVNDEEIRKLNAKFRGKDEPTDVLSFPMGGELLGDIVINADAAVRQAREYGHSLRRELAFLAAHSMLHLLGFDHKDKAEEDEMCEKQEEILKTLGIGRDIL